MMSDLRESGAIEQDADVILMTYRDDYYNPDSQFKGFAEVLIRKQRMGPLGDVELVFQGQFSRFCDADHRGRGGTGSPDQAGAIRPEGFDG